MIRVVVVDDQRLLRAGFISILAHENDIEVVGEAGDGRAALEVVGTLKPDVVLMDIRMPLMDGLEATEAISATDSLSSVKVIILTTFPEDEYVYRALRGGASGFLLKDTEPDDLVDAVRVVAGGDALIAPSITRRLIGEFARRAPRVQAVVELNALSEREIEVLKLVGSGLSNDEIAAQIVVSPSTAKTHVSRIMQKVNARDRARLVVLAYESGLVKPGWADTP